MPLFLRYVLFNSEAVKIRLAKDQVVWQLPGCPITIMNETVDVNCGIGARLPLANVSGRKLLN